MKKFTTFLMALTFILAASIYPANALSPSDLSDSPADSMMITPYFTAITTANAYITMCCQGV